MADETTTEQMNEIEQALEGGVDVDSPEITEKMKNLMAKLGVGQPEQDGPAPSSTIGAEVDWSEYDLDPRFAHLYPRARLEPAGDSLQWVVDITEFKALKGRIDENPFSQGKNRESIGQMITQMINGPEGWRIQSAVVPINATHGCVTLQRMFPIILPTPNVLKTEEAVASTVAPPTEEELAAMEKQALAWAAGEGDVPPPPATVADATNPPSLGDTLKRVGNEVTEYQPTKASVVPAAHAAAADFVASRQEGTDEPEASA